MEPFSFDKVPEVIRQLFEKVEKIELLIGNLQPKDPDENQLLTIQEAAEFLKVTVPSLYSKVSRKEIPVNKPGRRLYFYKNDLLDWVRANKKKTNTELQSEAAAMRRGSKYHF